MGLEDEARALLARISSLTGNFLHDRPGGNDAQLTAESLCVQLITDLFRRSRVPFTLVHTLEEQLARVGQADLRLVGFLRISLGMLHVLRGDLEAAEAQFAQCRQLNPNEAGSWLTLWLTYHRGSIALARGRLMEARYHLLAGMRLWRSDFSFAPGFRAIARIVMAEIDYELNSLAESRNKLGQELYTVEQIETWFEPYAGLYETAMMLHWHAGRFDRVESLLEQGMAISSVRAVLERFLVVLRLRFELLQGRVDRARSIVDAQRLDQQWEAPTFRDDFPCREWDLLGLCLCDLAMRESAPSRARSIATRLEHTARKAGRARSTVKALLFRAATAEAGESEAIGHALQALELAQPLGLRRTFLDEWALIRPILQAIHRQHDSSIPAHLAAYADDLSREITTARVESTIERDVVLSERELDVLRELSMGRSNKLIARQFGLSAPTIQFHMKSMFRKLGVHKRAAAVAEAHKRGWLT